MHERRKPAHSGDLQLAGWGCTRAVLAFAPPEEKQKRAGTGWWFTEPRLAAAAGPSSRKAWTSRKATGRNRPRKRENGAATESHPRGRPSQQFGVGGCRRDDPAPCPRSTEPRTTAATRSRLGQRAGKVGGERRSSTGWCSGRRRWGGGGTPRGNAVRLRSFVGTKSCRVFG